jgi:hypothetical protein
VNETSELNPVEALWVLNAQDWRQKESFTTMAEFIPTYVEPEEE